MAFMKDITRVLRLTEEQKALSIKATNLANLEMAGVDLLFDKAGNAYLLEINFPTGFSALIEICEVDIPLMMIEHLINKADTK